MENSSLANGDIGGRVRAIARQRLSFQQGLSVDERIVSPRILASWKRSRDYGVGEASLSKPVDDGELEQALLSNRELIDSAARIMEKLFSSISAARSLIGLADNKGLILHVVGRKEEIDRLAVFRQGYYATEEVAGTNGLGTCLVEQLPLEIIGCEHYAPAAEGWCCSAAPIFDNKGALAGVLNVSIATESYHHHTLGMVEAAAHAISEQLHLRKLVKEQETMLELIDEGVLILDAGGVISAMNNKARSMLQLRDGETGMNIRNVVKSSDVLDAVLSTRQRVNDQETQLQLRRGSVACTLSSAPVEEGLILTLRETRRMREYATRTIGAKAIYTFESIIGESTAIREVIRLARVATQSDITTLVLGESGTGKELFAQAIHNASPRRNAPFVVVNCGALPRTLVESELFGYEEGAFTGASRMGKPGKFELADGGTIFLDEIGEMPLDAQTSLLRLLQEGELTRVGGNRSRHINIRVIAATNRDLENEVRQNAFRQDLYYRLNVLTIHVPPLRERRADIRLLARSFLHKFAQSLGRSATDFSEEALEALSLYAWPGNVRELENIIERTINVSSSSLIDTEDLPPHILQPAALDRVAEAPTGTLKSKEAETIVETLRSMHGNMRAAAKELGIARSALYKKVERLGLSPDMWRK